LRKQKEGDSSGGGVSLFPINFFQPGCELKKREGGFNGEKQTRIMDSCFHRNMVLKGGEKF